MIGQEQMRVRCGTMLPHVPPSQYLEHTVEEQKARRERVRSFFRPVSRRRFAIELILVVAIVLGVTAGLLYVNFTS